MKHRLILDVRCKQGMESILRNFPKTVLAINSEAEPNSTGHHPMEVVYVDSVIPLPQTSDIDTGEKN